MMTKNEHINYWKKSSEEDWNTMSALFQSGRYVHSLYFAHLSLEKLCKAIWVQDYEGNFPPKVHNLVKLLSGTTFKLQDED